MEPSQLSVRLTDFDVQSERLTAKKKERHETFLIFTFRDIRFEILYVQNIDKLLHSGSALVECCALVIC